MRGFRIFVACLAVGVAAVAAVGSTTSAIRDGIAADGRKTLGGDISIRSLHRDIGPERKAWLEDSGTVSRMLRMRAMARTADRSARSLIELKAVDGVYPLYGALALTPAQSIDAALARDESGVWGAAVEDRLLHKLGVERGARIRIGDAEFEIRATIAHEPDRLGDGGLIGLGPKVIVPAESIAATGLVRPGSLVRYFYKVRLAPGIDLEGWRERLDGRFPQAAWRVRDRTNASPAAQRFIDGTQVFLTLIGLTALLVGGVGVGNAVGNYLAGRMETIATLKCVGASGGTIFGVYLIQILAMAAVGIVIGLVLGAAAPPLAGELVNAALGVEARFGVHPDVLGLAAAFGVLVALLFSIWPVARACEVPGSALFRAAIVEVRVWPRPWAVGATAAVAAILALLVVATADNLAWRSGSSAAARPPSRCSGRRATGWSAAPRGSVGCAARRSALRSPTCTAPARPRPRWCCRSGSASPSWWRRFPSRAICATRWRTACRRTRPTSTSSTCNPTRWRRSSGSSRRSPARTACAGCRCCAAGSSGSPESPLRRPRSIPPRAGSCAATGGSPGPPPRRATWSWWREAGGPPTIRARR